MKNSREKPPPLKLRKERLRVLGTNDLSAVAGGDTVIPKGPASGRGPIATN